MEHRLWECFNPVHTTKTVLTMCLRPGMVSVPSGTAQQSSVRTSHPIGNVLIISNFLNATIFFPAKLLFLFCHCLINWKRQKCCILTPLFSSYIITVKVGHWKNVEKTWIWDWETFPILLENTLKMHSTLHRLCTQPQKWRQDAAFFPNYKVKRAFTRIGMDVSWSWLTSSRLTF